jgi:hypothetical protein
MFVHHIIFGFHGVCTSHILGFCGACISHWLILVAAQCKA